MSGTESKHDSHPFYSITSTKHKHPCRVSVILIIPSPPSLKVYFSHIHLSCENILVLTEWGGNERIEWVYHQCRVKIRPQIEGRNLTPTHPAWINLAPSLSGRWTVFMLCVQFVPPLWFSSAKSKKCSVTVIWERRNSLCGPQPVTLLSEPAKVSVHEKLHSLTYTVTQV